MKGLCEEEKWVYDLLLASSFDHRSMILTEYAFGI